jgi:hypothetical protein
MSLRFRLILSILSMVLPCVRPLMMQPVAMGRDTSIQDELGYDSSSISAFAVFRSEVSKPSVNRS